MFSGDCRHSRLSISSITTELQRHWGGTGWSTGYLYQTDTKSHPLPQYQAPKSYVYSLCHYGPPAPMWHPTPSYPQNQSCYGYQYPLSHDFSGQCFHVNISHARCWHMPRSPLSGLCIHLPNAMSIGFQELTTASSPENWPQQSGKNLLPWKVTPLRAALIQ